MAKAARKKKTTRKKKKGPGIFARLVFALVAFFARHPLTAGGLAVFVVVFSFVSANAVWYQPGPHPDPLWRTRDATDRSAIPGRTMVHAPGPYNTFRIEREEATAQGHGDLQISDLLASIDSGTATMSDATPQDATPQAAPENATAPADAEPETAADPQTVSTDDTASLVAAIQSGLAQRGFYHGDIDGVSGPMTGDAIRAFQKHNGLAETGEASPALLKALTGAMLDIGPLPAHRPDTTATTDPVASVIRANADATEAVATPASDDGVTGRMVMEIQRGLANIAYEGIAVNGIAGTKTRQAILNFQKHYRLAETGDPSEEVLAKLKEIGAL